MELMLLSFVGLIAWLALAASWLALVACTYVVLAIGLVLRRAFRIVRGGIARPGPRRGPGRKDVGAPPMSVGNEG